MGELIVMEMKLREMKPEESKEFQMLEILDNITNALDSKSYI